MRKGTLLAILFSVVLISAPSYAEDELQLEDINGSSFNFSSLKGKWVFINYWASWCGPCLDEIAEFNQLYDSKPDNIAVFAVNFDSVPLFEQKIMAKKFSIHYPSLQQRSTSQLPLGNISVVPVTFVFNPAGKLATTLYGGQTIQSLKEAISAQEQP
jgi:thiol-disulfide isomerase/thioredoxin